jgi:hypothetical protein
MEIELVPKPGFSAKFKKTVPKAEILEQPQSLLVYPAPFFILTGIL